MLDMRGTNGCRLSAASVAVMVLGCSGAVHAADLSNLPTKAPPIAPGPSTCTSIQDFFTTACQLAWYGVRFYGAIDVGGPVIAAGMVFALSGSAQRSNMPGNVLIAFGVD